MITALNVTITDGAVSSFYGSSIAAVPLSLGMFVGSTTSALQTFVDTYFKNAYLAGDASMVVWIWQPGVTQVVFSIIYSSLLRYLMNSSAFLFLVRSGDIFSDPSRFLHL
jgi:hypothetical protein